MAQRRADRDDRTPLRVFASLLAVIATTGAVPHEERRTPTETH